MPTVPPQSIIPPAVTAPTPAQNVALLAMFLCWALAIVIALWGSIREGRRVDRERRREIATEREPGPTPGIDGLLDRWALWALGFLGLGLALLGFAANIAKP